MTKKKKSAKSSLTSETKKARTSASAKKTGSTTTSTKTKKATTKTTASSKVAGVKKKLSEEVAKGASEKSGTIKINSDSAKKTATKATTRKATTRNPETIKGIFEELDKEFENEEYNKKLNITSIEDEIENKFDINELEKEIRKQKEIPNTDLKNIIKMSCKSLVFAIVFIAFFIFVNFGFYKFNKIALIKDLNIFAFVFLGTAILLIESAYKNEKASTCANGLETLAMAIFTLILPYVYQIHKNEFIKTIKYAGMVVGVYYIIKMIIVFLGNKKKYLRSKEDFIKDEEPDSEFDDDDDDDEDDEFDDLE